MKREVVVYAIVWVREVAIPVMCSFFKRPTTRLGVDCMRVEGSSDFE